jgi:catechol 2,3-dioxygenase-like lactoylglutathione lyase family enzyme
MKTSLSHIGINLSSEEKCFPFWQDLLKYLEFELMLDGNHFDASAGHTFLCFSTTKPGYQGQTFHRKHTGLNHVAFSVASRQEVDKFVKEYLEPHKIPTLYGAAKEYNYVPGYYAVYFEDPDRIKVEVAFTGEVKTET